MNSQRHLVLGSRNYYLFRLAGFEVRLDLSSLLLAFLITWTLAISLFPFRYPDLPAYIYWGMGMVGAVGVFLSIVLHELSHSLVARHFGLPIRGITLFIFGGMAEIEDEPPHPKAEFLIALVGPIASFILAFIFFQLENLALAYEWSPAIVGVNHYLGIINMALAIFNLIPAFPLDGGRILRAGLWYWKKNLLSATRIASSIGSGFGLVLMILGVFAFIQGSFIGGMWWFLIGIFIRGAAKASLQKLLLHEIVHGRPVRDFMNKRPITLSPDISVQQLMDDYVYRYHFKMFPVVENSKLLGCINIDDVKKVPQAEWPEKTVRDLLTPCASAAIIPPDKDTDQLLTAMMQPGAATRAMVVENDRLIGIISFKDLRELLTLKLNMELKN